MYIVIQHQISNPPAFWAAAQKALPNLPKGIRALQVMPNKDGTRAVCLWEAGSIDAVKQVIEPSEGQVSRNEYFAVETANAMGLPS